MGMVSGDMARVGGSAGVYRIYNVENGSNGKAVFFRISSYDIYTFGYLLQNRGKTEVEMGEIKLFDI
jgi:hypothetical protein